MNEIVTAIRRSGTDSDSAAAAVPEPHADEAIEMASAAGPRTEAQLQASVEAVLLAAGRSVPITEFVALFAESERPSPAQVRAAVQALNQSYGDRPQQIVESGAGLRMQVRKTYAELVSRLWPERPQRYSRALLETLALIAYRQPITRAEIENVRGVAVNPNIIRTLQERSWIHVVGHRDLPGRPESLGTTRTFLEYFGLRRLEDLPPLEDIRNLDDAATELDQAAQLPIASAAVDGQAAVEPEVESAPEVTAVAVSGGDG